MSLPLVDHSPELNKQEFILSTEPMVHRSDGQMDKLCDGRTDRPKCFVVTNAAFGHLEGPSGPPDPTPSHQVTVGGS